MFIANAAGTGEVALLGHGELEAVIGASEAACSGPLTDYCMTDCPTYAESIDSAQKGRLALSVPCAAEGAPLRTASCGGMRVIHHIGSRDSGTHYFGADGSLVGAVQTVEEAAFCGGTSRTKRFGVAPACSETDVHGFCKR